jgi:hypothetical protein
MAMPSLAQTSLILQAFGAGSSVAGSYYEALGQKYALRLQARLDEVNAKISEGKARDSLQRGEREEQAVRLGTAQLKGTQTAAVAANGVDLTSDTAVAILTSTDVLGELDANTVKANALREAWGHRIEAVNYRGKASTSRATAKAISPMGAAVGTLLTEASRYGSTYSAFKESGALDPKPKTTTTKKTRLSYIGPP